ncbi:hypothetical protein NQ176_g3816 [Zarea fungicola]|uniref:Uncharacterized protein n=1 Tax=Zarea fungicola TaxID=93591 RepID=A0ACC1NJ44_9HYPO|nr:hypothetical protein NQ176_g3816 [Lecanicillium fungicola]
MSRALFYAEPYYRVFRRCPRGANWLARKWPHLIGGENMTLFTSTHDPAFFAHLAMSDRLAIWQSRDPATRQNAIYGTTTFLNYPPSRNVTLLDVVVMDQLEASL